MNLPEYMTVEEVAARLRVSKMTVYRAVERGDMDAIRVGRSIRVDKRDVFKFIREATTTPDEHFGGAA